MQGTMVRMMIIITFGLCVKTPCQWLAMDPTTIVNGFMFNNIRNVLLSALSARASTIFWQISFGLTDCEKEFSFKWDIIQWLLYPRVYNNDRGVMTFSIMEHRFPTVSETSIQLVSCTRTTMKRKKKKKEDYWEFDFFFWSTYYSLYYQEARIARVFCAVTLSGRQWLAQIGWPVIRGFMLGKCPIPLGCTTPYRVAGYRGNDDWSIQYNNDTQLMPNGLGTQPWEASPPWCASNEQSIFCLAGSVSMRLLEKCWGTCEPRGKSEV